MARPSGHDAPQGSALPDVAATAPLSRSAAETLAQTLRMIADPTRLQLLSIIINGSVVQEVSVGELTRHLGLRQPTISHHLRRMHEARLLDRKQRGRHVWYSRAADRRAGIAELLR